MKKIQKHFCTLSQIVILWVYKFQKILSHFSKLINVKTVLSIKKNEITGKVLNRMPDVLKNYKDAK